MEVEGARKQKLRMQQMRWAGPSERSGDARGIA